MDISQGSETKMSHVESIEISDDYDSMEVSTGHGTGGSQETNPHGMKKAKLVQIDMGDHKEACPDPTVIIDIPDLEDLKPDDHDLNKTCTRWIQRVPRKLRQRNEAAYTPTLVSIGPFHHGKPALKAMEHLKAKYYHKFWKRDFCKHIWDKDMIGDFISEGDRRQRIRNSYAGTFDQPVKNEVHFTKVILRDSCFIFELLLRNYENRGKKPEEMTDYILRTPWLKKAIELDLIMVENQLPYFVFTELYEFILKNQNSKIPDCLSKKHQKECEGPNFITKITLKFFEDYSNRKVENIEISEETERFQNIIHFTDLVRDFLRPDKRGRKNMYTSCRYSAKELDRAGVYFSPCEDKYLADIDKEGGKFICWSSLTLKIPPFMVQGNTEHLMRNVMALEQCLYPFHAYICNYIALLDQLINTDEDVEVLVQNKVVENLLGSNNEVAGLINTLCQEIVEPNFWYGDICDLLNNHCENYWNIAKATLKRVYFKDIWTGSSTIVAVVVLIFSIVSVIATIKDLFF